MNINKYSSCRKYEGKANLSRFMQAHETEVVIKFTHQSLRTQKTNGCR
jgi:predicted RNA-binding protein YlxR (DUF448 family)